MKCPDEIAAILAEILTTGLLIIRGNSSRDDLCHRHADHLHNLPALLSNYNPDLLDYYWNVERPSFVRQAPGAEIQPFQRLWSQLEPLVLHPAEEKTVSFSH